MKLYYVQHKSPSKTTPWWPSYDFMNTEYNLKYMLVNLNSFSYPEICPLYLTCVGSILVQEGSLKSLYVTDTERASPEKYIIILQIWLNQWTDKITACEIHEKMFTRNKQ